MWISGYGPDALWLCAVTAILADCGDHGGSVDPGSLGRGGAGGSGDYGSSYYVCGGGGGYYGGGGGGCGGSSYPAGGGGGGGGASSYAERGATDVPVWQGWKSRRVTALSSLAGSGE
jgi:hypothetical protein